MYGYLYAFSEWYFYTEAILSQSLFSKLGKSHILCIYFVKAFCFDPDFQGESLPGIYKL
jgi:hypothetical protein